jgi:hypothetical protein
VLDYAWLYDLVDPDEQVRGRALERRQSAVAERQDDPILAFLRPYPEPDMAFASVALLFLRWEASYPDEWRAPDSHAYSPWSIKQAVLGRFGDSGVPDMLRSEAADLVLTAVLRPYRCKDWRYALLVDHVQTPASKSACRRSWTVLTRCCRPAPGSSSTSPTGRAGRSTARPGGAGSTRPD